MINKRKKEKLNLEVTEIGLGTAPLGGWPIAVNEEEAFKTLETVWNQGIRYFDTAPLMVREWQKYVLENIYKIKTEMIS